MADLVSRIDFKEIYLYVCTLFNVTISTVEVIWRRIMQEEDYE